MSLVLLAPKRAAAKLGVSLATFNRWRLRSDEWPLPAPRLVRGRKMWVDADLDAWIAALPRADTEPSKG